MSDLVPRNELTKQAMKGVGGIAGGAALLVVRALVGGSLVGALIVGGLVAVVGLIMTRDKADRKAGLVAVAAGAITIGAFVIPGIRGIALTLLLISGIGLVGAGVWSLIKFFRNLRRSK